jgi:hypothetical protein
VICTSQVETLAIPSQQHAIPAQLPRYDVNTKHPSASGVSESFLRTHGTSIGVLATLNPAHLLSTAIMRPLLHIPPLGCRQMADDPASAPLGAALARANVSAAAGCTRGRTANPIVIGSGENGRAQQLQREASGDGHAEVAQHPPPLLEPLPPGLKAASLLISTDHRHAGN